MDDRSGLTCACHRVSAVASCFPYLLFEDSRRMDGTKHQND